MNKDIKQIAFIYIIVVLIIWLTCMHFEAKKNIERLKNDLIEAKKVAVELHQDKNNYIVMLNSMNNYADKLESDLREYKHLDKIYKDLR